MIRGGRGYASILGGRAAGEIAELTREVGLVAVAGVDCDVGQGAAGPQRLQRPRESEHADVLLGGEAD